MKRKIVTGQKIICLNRKASFNYFFIELIEAGIVLKGSEVKSLRDGKGNIADSYAIDNNGELYLINSKNLFSFTICLIYLLVLNEEFILSISKCLKI